MFDFGVRGVGDFVPKKQHPHNKQMSQSKDWLIFIP